MKTKTEKEIERRQRILTMVDGLVSNGHSAAQAAQLANVNPTTLWRWRNRIKPRFENSGRASAFSAFTVSPQLISKVQRLQLAGLSNDSAWRAIAEDPICPADVAAFVRGVVKMPHSFLKATALKRSNARIIQGNDFTHVQPKGKGA